MKQFPIQWREPSELTPYHNNPKAHSTEQVDRIAGSLAEFDFDQPIVVDAKGVIIKGHGRREAALRLALERVPVIVRDDLNDAQSKALRIADNKSAESPWLESELKKELDALRAENFDMKLTGFEEHELERLLPEDQVPDVEFKEFTENIEKDVPMITCPHCGESFAK